MRNRFIVAALTMSIALAGCTKRWEPEGGPGPLTFVQACPGRKAPAVADFGNQGVTAVYHFVVTGASQSEIVALVERAEKAGLDVDLGTLMIVMNGTDALFAESNAPIVDQSAVDAQFAKICAIKVRNTYLTHVRYNRVGVEEDQGRVR